MIRLDSKTTKAKILLVAAIAAGLIFAYFSVRWQFGDLLAEVTPLGGENAAAAASAARSLAPGDPLTQWFAANKEKENFSSESIDKAVAMFEDLVRLSPDDYRWWLELGRAYEQAEKPEKAEAAFRKALDLAPEYTYTHWQLGNFLLRQNRVDEAFAELRFTAAKSYIYREQVFGLAWDYFGQDPKQVEALASDAPDVRASLALFYAQRKSAENSLRVWNTLTDEQKAENPKIAKTIAQALYDQHKYLQSVEFASQSGLDPSAKPEAITNGGFEESLLAAEDSLFGWKVTRGEPKADISTDSVTKKEGKRSVRVTFKGYAKQNWLGLMQAVAVEPLGRYRLHFLVRTENLRSAGMPALQAVSAETNELLGQYDIAVGTADWQAVTLEFVVPENTEGILLQTIKMPCPQECPIVGTFWYDDLSIERVQ